MIKGLLLMVAPTAVWERIAAVPRKWPFILFTFYLPLVLLGCVAEGFGLVRWGKPRGIVSVLRPFPLEQAIIYEVMLLILWLAVAFLLARLIKSLGDTFHGRHTFSQAFTVAAFALGPLLYLRVFEMFPAVPLWATWAVGVCFSAGVLYSGIPRVMKPDPPHALGLYFMTVLLIAIITGLMRFLMIWYLQGKFAKLDGWISRLIG